MNINEAGEHVVDRIQGETAPHPWKRYLARGIDRLLCSLVITLLWNGLLGQISFVGAVGKLAEGIAALIIMLLAEPLFLMLFATTPGKWIFGISVYSGSGRKLTYAEGFCRTRTVLIKGMGFGIPVIEYIRLYLSYRACVGSEGLDWDYSIYGEEYQIREKSLPAIVIPYVCVCLAAAVTTGYVVLTQFLPPNRGELSVAEFAENYNYYVKLFGRLGEDNGGICLNEDGQFPSLPVSGGSDGVVLNVIHEPQLKLKYAGSEEALTAVSFEQNISEEGRGVITGYGKEMRYMILAYAAADRDIQIFRRNFWELLDSLNYSDIVGKDYTLTVGELRVECNVEYDSDEWFLVEGTVLFPKTEEQTGYYIKFNMTKAEQIK